MIKKLLITRSYLGDTQIKPFELNVNHGLLIKGARKVTVLQRPVQVLSDKDTRIKYIIHISDIHIKRSSEYTQEYKDVFKNFIEQTSIILSEFCYTKQDVIILDEKVNEAKRIIDKDIQICDQSVTPFTEEVLLVITGDILHSHLAFEDVSIKLCRAFTNAMNTLFNVVMIHGNHDLSILDNSSNLLREGLSGIVANIPNAVLLVDSGVYIMNNLALALYSLCDKKLPNIRIPECRSRTTISLYHGQVLSMNKLENSEISYSNLPCSIFETDITLLGDAHTHRYLNKECTMAYAGSLIQQSIQENLDHGFVLWNLQDHVSEFIKVENKRGRVRFVFENDVMMGIPELVEENIVYCKCINSTKDFCIEMVKDYINQQGKKYIKIIPEMEIQLDNIDGIEYNNYNDSLIDNTCHINLIKQYNNLIADKRSDEYIGEILNIHNTLFQKIDKKTITVPNVPYHINHVYFSNIFSFGENNFLDLTDKHSVVGIVGLNSSGKSNILRILEWCIWGPSEKYPTKFVINNNSTGKLMTMVEIVQGNKKYCILRANTNAFKKPSKVLNPNAYIKMTTELLVFDEVTNTFSRYDETFSDDQKEQAIIDLFGPSSIMNDIFVMIQKAKGFTDAITPFESYKYFSKYYDFHIYDELWRLASSKLSKLETELRILDKSLTDRKKKQEKSALNVVTNKLNVLLKKCEDIPSELIKIRDLKSDLQRRITNDYIETNYPELASKTILELEDLLSPIENIIEGNEEQLREHIVKSEDMCQSLKCREDKRKQIFELIKGLIDKAKSCNVLQPDETVLNCFDYVMIKSDLDYLEKNIQSSSAKIRTFKLKINDVTEGDTRNYLSQIIRVTEQINGLITTPKNKKLGNDLFASINIDVHINNITEDLKKAIACERKKLKTYRDQIVLLKQKQYINFAQFIRESQAKSVNEISILFEQLNQEDNLIEQLQTERKILKQIIKNSNSTNLSMIERRDNILFVMKNIVSNNNIERKLRKLDITEKNLEEENQKNSKQITKFMCDKNKIEKEIQDYDRDCAMRERLTDAIEKHRFYKCMICPNGIPKFILKNLVQKTEIVTNQILQLFSSKFNIKFIIEDGSPNTTKDYEAYPHIKIQTTHDFPLDMTLTSCGFEGFVLNFCVRLAIAQIVGIKTIDFIAIDEFLSVLDVENADQLEQFLEYIGTNFRTCFLISHNPLITKHYKDQIFVDKRLENDTSYLTDNDVDKKEISDAIQHLVDVYVIGKKKDKTSTQVSNTKAAANVAKELEVRMQDKNIQLVGINNKMLLKLSPNTTPSIKDSNIDTLNVDDIVKNSEDNNQENSVSESSNLSNPDTTITINKSVLKKKSKSTKKSTRKRGNRINFVFDNTKTLPEVEQYRTKSK